MILARLISARRDKLHISRHIYAILISAPLRQRQPEEAPIFRALFTLLFPELRAV